MIRGTAISSFDVRVVDVVAGIRTRQGLNARFSGPERRFVLRSDTRFRGKISVPLRVARRR